MNVLELPGRVSDLEQQLSQALKRIQELEQRPTPSSLQPNVLTDVNGQIGALFSGGVTIPEQTSATPNPGNSFNFQNNGTLTQYLLGYFIAGEHRLALTDHADANDFVGLLLSAVPAGPNGASVLQAHAEDAANASPVAATILDSAGRSNFLQLLSALKLRLDFGSDNVTYPGASNFTNATLVAHGLGVVPQAYVALPTAGFPANPTIIYSTAATAADITFNGYDPIGQPANGQAVAFNWIAIG